MTETPHTLTIAGLPLPQAQAAGDALEELPAPPDAVSINEVDEAAGLWSVTAYFTVEDGAMAAQAALAGQGHAVVRSRLAARNWVRESLEGLAPVTAGRFQLTGSHDRDRRRLGGIALEIDAGTAFGTGHHGTTAGCLLALDQLLKQRRPRRILDLGCGTGVLALAAAVALKTAALATDIDLEAVRVTRANAVLNGAGPLVRALTVAGLQHPAVAASAPYDLIFANILARPLIALAPGIARVLARGGTLILSGLSHDQERMVAPAYRNRGLIPARQLRLGVWSVLVFTKR